jgi:two-component system, NtrC family, response regulator HydG
MAPLEEIARSNDAPQDQGPVSPRSPGVPRLLDGGALRLLRRELARTLSPSAAAEVLNRWQEACEAEQTMLRFVREEPQPAEPDVELAHSEAMRAVLRLACRAAGFDTTVLISGETGAGKSWIARLVHRRSAGAAGPFEVVACGALSGAAGELVDLLARAPGGTLLLDEVADLSPEQQGRLVRALQLREAGPLPAGAKPVRLVAATSRSLRAEVDAGRFRKDLFFRLKVMELHLPPLRERPEDVLPLARHQLSTSAHRLGKRLTAFSPRAAEQLRRHAWPGNVRELESVVAQAAALAEGPVVDLQDLPVEIQTAGRSAAAAPGQRSLADLEREAVLAALEAHGGHQGRTAAALGIGTATLYRKLKAWRGAGDPPRRAAAAPAGRPPSPGAAPSSDRPPGRG